VEGTVGCDEHRIGIVASESTYRALHKAACRLIIGPPSYVCMSNCDGIGFIFG